ncbi:MAG: hypothetical protein N2690_06375 [Rhodocyclaceae bacterium]|nr:hypothetical protein [Rhodocyclaceae bacterium]
MSRARLRFALPVLALSMLCRPVQAVEAGYTPPGRLFMTPEWRVKLERFRQLNLQEVRHYEGGSVRLDGVVVRSSGKTTVWINGQPQTEADGQGGLAAQAHPRQPGQARIVIGTEPAADLKVGVTLNRATHETAGGLAGGEIRIHRK